MPDSDYGTAFDERSSEPIDEWSRSVFAAYRDWPLAGTGRWFRSDEGWLRLRIEQFEGEQLAPLSAIELDTADEQIVVDCGSWCVPLSGPHGQSYQGAQHPVVRARELIEGWLIGAVKLASYSDEAGWRGSKIIDGGEMPDAIEPVPIAIGNHGVVIIKALRRRDWRSWRHAGDGTWVQCEVTED